jgi:hypothetical protein
VGSDGQPGVCLVGFVFVGGLLGVRLGFCEGGWDGVCEGGCDGVWLGVCEGVFDGVGVPMMSSDGSGNSSTG